MNEKVVYTRWLAIELIKAGFPAVRVEQSNKVYSHFDCWVFNDTPEFKVAFANIANRKK